MVTVVHCGHRVHWYNLHQLLKTDDVWVGGVVKTEVEQVVGIVVAALVVVVVDMAAVVEGHDDIVAVVAAEDCLAMVLELVLYLLH